MELRLQYGRWISTTPQFRLGYRITEPLTVDKQAYLSMGLWFRLPQPTRFHPLAPLESVTWAPQQQHSMGMSHPTEIRPLRAMALIGGRRRHTEIRFRPARFKLAASART